MIKCCWVYLVPMSFFSFDYICCYIFKANVIIVQSFAITHKFYFIHVCMYVCMKTKYLKWGIIQILFYKKRNWDLIFTWIFFHSKFKLVSFMFLFILCLFVISDMCTVLYIRDPCNSPRCVLHSLFSVGTHLDFQILTMVGFSKIFKSHKIK